MVAKVSDVTAEVNACSDGDISKKVEDILSRRLDGLRVASNEARYLSTFATIHQLGYSANRLTRDAYGMQASYCVDTNINYTNICETGCGFCAFCRVKSDTDSYVLKMPRLLKKVNAAVKLGGTQILLQGGHNPDLDLHWHECMLRAIKDNFEVHIHGYSPPEIDFISRNNELDIETVLARLKTAGLDSLPGGGAEILVDKVRSRISPKKCNSSTWLKVMHTAHDLGLPGTATMMFGAGESWNDRVEHLQSVRKLQDITGGFTAFIPWGYQPTNTKLGGTEPSGVDYLRVLALSRIILDNTPHIQASWVTQGRHMAELALSFGADDFGSTMLEENVVRAAGVSNHMSQEQIRESIERCGLAPFQRDTMYKRI